MTSGKANIGRRAPTTTSCDETGYRCAPMTLRKLLLATLLLMSLCVSTAQADSDQGSFVQDDDQLLYRGDRVATRTLVTARSLGAEGIRVTVLWRVAAQGADLSNAEIKLIKNKTLRRKALAQRKRFKPTDPRTYPTRNWDRYDNLVKTATGLGMRVLFAVTGPGPRYAHRIAPPAQRANAGTYKPIPSKYRRLRPSGRNALLGQVPRRERDPQAAAARQPVVAVERAQPARLAVAAVGERRTGLARALPRALPGGQQGARAERARQQRRHPARRDLAAGLDPEGSAQRHRADPVPARARLRPAERHAVHRCRRGGPPLRRLRQERPAQGIRLRAPSVHEEGRSDDQAIQPGRGHDREHRHARARSSTRCRRSPAARSRRACRSC